MRFQRLDEWLTWIQGLHFRTIDMSLDRVRPVWQALHPAPFAPVTLSIAGTNGKGSCVAYLDAILRAAGYRTGCYTSPHILTYNERVRVDGVPVSDARLCEAFQRVDEARGDTPLTYFEFGTLAALEIFATEGCDVAILEVGMGGRLDAVNLLDADAALITTVDLDHTQWLGDTRERIALEKAGILRAHHPAVFGACDPPTTLLDHCAGHDISLRVCGRDFAFEVGEGGWEWSFGDARLSGLPAPALRGVFQYANAAAVLTLLHEVRDRLPVTRAAIESGLSQVRLAGRFQSLPGAPEWLLDVAHNPQAAASLAANLMRYPAAGRTLAVFAALADKDLDGILRPVTPFVSAWFLAPTSGERGQPAEVLAKALGRLGIAADAVTLATDAAEAFRLAAEQATAVDRILVFGSFLTVEAALRWRMGDPASPAGEGGSFISAP